MDLLSRIMVAVDGSPPSNSAVRLALRLAVLRHGLVSFVSIFERDALIGSCTADSGSGFAIGEILQTAEAECKGALDAARTEARVAGVNAVSVMRTGRSGDAIVDEAREWNASCIAIGTHGRKGLARAFLGSCTEDVLHKSPIPVLVGHTLSADGADGFDRILCAVDDSPAARRAFHAAAALARDLDAELHVLSVVQIADEYALGYEVDGFDPDGSMSAIYGQARAAVMALAAEVIASGTRIKPHIFGGSDVAERIVHCATARRCGLIVLGTHGRSGFRRAILGSTAEGVLRSSTIPVLAFRDPRERDSAGHVQREGALTAP